MRITDQMKRTYLKSLIRPLATHRSQIGLTQDDANEKIGIADRLINKWEVGMKLPSMFSLYCWCEALGMELKLLNTQDDCLEGKTYKSNKK